MKRHIYPHEFKPDEIGSRQCQSCGTVDWGIIHRPADSVTPDEREPSKDSDELVVEGEDYTALTMAVMFTTATQLGPSSPNEKRFP